METLGMTGERPAEDRVGRLLSGFGPKARRARRERGMTLERLAAAAGTSAAHLSRLESGQRQPSLDGALRLALALGVPFSDLFEEREEPDPGTVVRGTEAPFYEGPGFRVQPLVPEAGPEGIAAVKGIYRGPAPVRGGTQEFRGGGLGWPTRRGGTVAETRRRSVGRSCKTGGPDGKHCWQYGTGTRRGPLRRRRGWRRRGRALGRARAGTFEETRPRSRRRAAEERALLRRTLLPH